jgi:hypothetical protein
MRDDAGSERLADPLIEGEFTGRAGFGAAEN